MEALALYLWHLLSSRDEYDTDEEEVELAHVKLPEITVLRKNDEPSETCRKRKRVSFAEPLHKNGPITNSRNDTMKSQRSRADHYTLVPVDTDHDYTPAPLVCYRRLPDGGEVRMPVEVKPASQKQIVNQIPLVSHRVTLKKSEFTDPKFVKEERNKTYKPVHGWNELLEQLDTKPEDGDKLFDELISALGGNDEQKIGDDEQGSYEDDERVCNDSDINGSDESDSVEILWESSSQLKGNGNSIMQGKYSDREPSKNVYSELFDKFVEDVAPLKVISGDLKNPDDSSWQSGNASDHLKGSVDHPVDADNMTASKELPKDEALLPSDVGSSEEQADLNCSVEQPGKTREEHSSDEPSGIVIAGSESVVFLKTENGDENSGSSPVRPADSIEQHCISSVQPGATVKLSSSSFDKSEADIQTTVPVPNFKDLCDWAFPLLSASETHSLAVDRSDTALARKRKRVKTTADQPKVKKKRVRKPGPPKMTPLENLSKKQIISRLAKEIRSSHDPRDMMDDDHFKATFGVSKEFANFLINSLTPHLHVPEKSRADRTPVHLKVLTALHFFATGNRNREVGHVTHMSQPQVSRSLTEVIDVLIITAPEPELPTSDSEFNELYGLPHIIGAVDATHVPIRPPDGIGRKCPGKERFENPASYKNSAHYFSINVEIVSSSSNRVLFCCTKLPGTSTKSLIWRKSKVRELMIARHVEGNSSDKLIAGSGYDCEPWLLTPCSVTYSHSPEDRYYNSSLASALQDSTRLTIGLLKGRFKCLGMASSQQALYYSPAKACQVITACCVLHNLAMDFGEEMPDPTFDELDLVETQDVSTETNWDGLEARNSYILEHFC